MNHLNQVSLRRHYRVDILVSRWRLVQHIGIFAALSKEPALEGLKVDIQWIATTIEVAVDQFPHWKQNLDERRRLRSGLYKPLLDNKVPAKACNEIIENVMNVLEKV